MQIEKVHLESGRAGCTTPHGDPCPSGPSSPSPQHLATLARPSRVCVACLGPTRGVRLMEGGRRVFNRGAGCVRPGSRCRAALPSALQASEAAGGAGPGGHGQSLLGVPGAEPGAGGRRPRAQRPLRRECQLLLCLSDILSQSGNAWEFGSTWCSGEQRGMRISTGPRAVPPPAAWGHL